MLALAAYTGVYGLSSVTVLVGLPLLRALRGLWGGPGLRPLDRVACATGVAACLVALVPWLLEPDPPQTLRVAVLQGNIDQGVKWSRDWYERTLSIYVELTRQAAAEGAELVVWPETAVPGAVGSDGSHAERVVAVAREVGVPLLVGAVGIETPPGETRSHLYDSAFLVDGQGEFRDRYDKSHLVPFGEYVPFQDLVGRFLEAVARGIADSGVTAGPGPRVMLVEPREVGVLTAGVPICYELLFPDLVRRFVNEGAEILLAITNDAWYGRTGAPYQFLAITALRSAENRVWTARAANTGVSAIIDAKGRVRKQTRIFERAWLVADVPLRPAPAGGSFYSRYGDVFAGVCWAVSIVAIAVAQRRRPGT